MKIIISPAKKMKLDSGFDNLSEPVFKEDAFQMADYLRNLTVSDIQEMMKTSEKIAFDTFRYYDEFFDDNPLTAAVEAYDGIQYSHIHSDKMDSESLEYMNGSLRILSGLYGVLKPFDGIRRYRLEMAHKMDYRGFKRLYSYWSDRLYNEIMNDEEILVNLASNEYSKAVLKYAKPSDRIVTVDFKENVRGRLKTVATHAKILRGEMVTYMCLNRINDTESLKSFKYDGFRFTGEKQTARGLVMTFAKDGLS